MTKKTKKGKRSVMTDSDLIDTTRRKSRLGDYLAEKVIKGVAFLSITIIVLIFVFVFREAFPIFSSKSADQVMSVGNTAEGQETYGEVTDKPVAQDTQATYGEVTDKTVSPKVVQGKDSVTAEPVDSVYTVGAGSGFDSNQTALKSVLTKDWVPVSKKPRYGILSLIVG